jgi:hypothetical protein
MKAKAGEFVRSVNGSFLDCRRSNLEKKTYRKGRCVVVGKARGRGMRGRK